MGDRNAVVFCLARVKFLRQRQKPVCRGELADYIVA